MHVRETGGAGRAAVLLLHGFPELSYSWRKVMPPLADAGFHVVAPDQRGYGETTGFDGRYDGDLAQYRMLNLVEDMVALLRRLNISSAHVVGHDFGSPVAAYMALTRPETVKTCVLMSAPFGGVPIGIAAGGRSGSVHDDLAKLGRKHYQWYYSTREADADMRREIRPFLRAYYHYKSADWKGNQPFRLAEWSAAELAKMPTYYVMELDKGMAQTVAPYLPSEASAWLTDAELDVYARAFERTGFQPGLNWYRCMTNAPFSAGLATATAGKKITMPSMFIAGKSDWGVYQKPGEFERMQESVCTDFRGAHLVEGAGHWVQQEQPEKTVELLLAFLESGSGR
jgi:pimeloyl-ACP methyl ester carboxylesterase